MFVRLKPTWPGVFRRSVKTADGVRVLSFSPGAVIELTDAADIAAIGNDVGYALEEVAPVDTRQFQAVSAVEETPATASTGTGAASATPPAAAADPLAAAVASNAAAAKSSKPKKAK